MTPILERRLDALGRQAVAEAVTPAPPGLMSAVAERQASRAALRATISCAAIGCFLLTGLAAYMMLPAASFQEPGRPMPAVSTQVASPAPEAAPTKEPGRTSGAAIQAVAGAGGEPAGVVRPSEERKAPLAKDHRDPKPE